MKKTLVLACVAGMSFAAFATDYTWTGSAGNNLWADKDNWGGVDYPRTSSDTATIKTSVTITFDGGADMPLTKVCASGSGVVVRLNAEEGSSMQFAAAGNGPATADGGELYFNVPATAPGTIYPSATGGPLHYLSSFSVAAGKTTYVGSYNCTHLFEGSCAFNVPQICNFGWGGINPKVEGQHALYKMTDSAKLTVFRLFLVGNGSTNAASVDFIQDGDDTHLQVGTLECGAYQYSTTVYNNGTYGIYNLKRGTAIVTNVTLGAKVDGRFIQEGGSFYVGDLKFFSNASRFAVLGGSFCAKQVSQNNATCPFELSNCTFTVSNSWTVANKVVVSGPVTFDLPSGVTLSLKNVEVAGNWNISQTGPGKLNVCFADGSDLDNRETKLSGDLSVGGNESSLLAISGGSLTCASLGGTSNGRLAVNGGTLALTAAATSSDAPNLVIAMNGGTFAVSNNVSLSTALEIAGTVTFDIPANKTLTLVNSPSFATGAKIVKKGAGTLKLAAATTVWRGDLEIVEGMVDAPERIENPDGDNSVHTVTIRDGALLCANKSTGNYACQWNVPVKMYVYGEGYVTNSFSSGYFMCRELYTNDVKAARGEIRCVSPNTSGAVFRSDAANSANRSSFIVSYTWTGAGDGETWSQAENWADGELPPNSASTYVDLSDCERVKLTADVTVQGIFTYRSKGDKRTVIEADSQKTMWQYVNRDAYQVGGYVAEGRELVFRNVLFKRSSDTNNKIGYIFGLAHSKIVFSGNQQNFSLYGYNSVPYYFVNATNTSGTATIGTFTLTDNGSVYFDSGTDMRFGMLYSGVSGHGTWRRAVFKEGSKVAFSTGIYATRHHPTRHFEVVMEGGDVTVTGANGLSIGTSDNPKTTAAKGEDGRLCGSESFLMKGGTLTVPRVASECNRNHAYLYGGTINLGAGGFVLTASETTKTNSYSPNVDAPIVWGGTTVHATDSFDFALDAKLVADGGQPTIDVPEDLSVTVVSNFSGSVSLRKTGAGGVVFEKAQPISMDVAGGTVSFASGADLDGEMGTLVLSDASNLSLASGQTLKVKRLVVNGADQESGTWGDGAVVVSGDDDWLAPARTTQNCTITLAADKEVADLQYAYSGTEPGTLTIDGSGTLTIGASDSIYVGAGDTLVFKTPVVVANASFSINGGGDVVFEGGLECTANNTQGFVRGGTYVTIKSTVGGNKKLALFAVTASSAHRMSKIRIEAGGTLNQRIHWPTSSSADSATSLGGVCEVVEGGRLNLLTTSDNNLWFAFRGEEKVVLDGGTISLRASTQHKGATGVLDFRSGTVEIGGALVSTVFTRSFEISLGGEVTFDVVSDTDAVAKVAATLTGAGTFVKAGAKTLLLTGATEGLSGYRAAEGTLGFGESSSIEPGADLTVAVGATVCLDYIGARTVETFHIGTRGKKDGTYSAANCTSLAGTGLLVVTKSTAPGVFMMIK